MSRIQRLFTGFFAIFLAFSFSAPAAASGVPTKYTSDESYFIGFIDFGQVISNPNGTPSKINGQKVLYAKVSSDNRLTGLDIVTFNARFNAAGSGPSVGTRDVTAGVYTILQNATCTPGQNGCIMVLDFNFQPVFVVFTPAENGCRWSGIFYTDLQDWGQVAPKSVAVLSGKQGQCDGLIAKETAAYNAISGMILRDN